MTHVQSNSGADYQSNYAPNSDADSNTPAEVQLEVDATENVPMLKFQGQTPIPKPCNKRGCEVLSPIEQQNPADTNLLQLIETTIRTSINDIIPTMFAKLKQEMKEVMKAMIDDATSDMKKQVFSEVKSQLCLQEGRCNL